MSAALAEIARKLGIGLIYKTSFDKANRTSLGARAASGSKDGLPILAEVREATGLPGADRRARARAMRARSPRRSMCCRSRPSSAARPICLLAAAETGKRDQHQEGPVPGALGHEERRGEDRLDRQRAASCCASAAPASATTRWSSTCARCRSWRRPAIRWCSTRPMRCSSRAGRATARGGEREFGPVLARAAVAVGVAAVFMETHQDPDHAARRRRRTWCR